MQMDLVDTGIASVELLGYATVWLVSQLSIGDTNF
jgi:hypothetical protein